MENITIMLPCDERTAMTSALPLMTSVQLATSRGRIQGISAPAAGSVIGMAVRQRAVDGISVADLGAKRGVPTYHNSNFAGGVRCSLFARPPV
ncbi:hypothetical protein [Flexivirga caeni]|uniref:Uncharacterized protein n=1 Tax=Flexivirga caeni TaxID=2294115 RepID=A0A3M9M775_9MICO|nr:hypothetical protein [Flexivirga caeni]RNI21067.1 hypothetical protein EFY87_12325 [Flexivirga caeni]